MINRFLKNQYRDLFSVFNAHDIRIFTNSLKTYLYSLRNFRCVVVRSTISGTLRTISLKKLYNILGNVKSTLLKVLLFATVIYHFVLAWLYGGFPKGGYPDEYWVISTGVYLVESVPRASFQYPIVDDKMIMLPLYIGILYKIFSFPTFFYVLCSWGFFSMIILMLGVYLIGKYYLRDEEIGYLAALLVGWNWHVGWYAHRLLNDVMLAAFMMLTFGLSSALFIGRVGSEKIEYMLTSLLGMSIALSMWAKESAFYLMPPLLLWMGAFLTYYKKEESNTKKKLVLLFSFFAFFLPFSYVCLIRYDHPIYPLIKRIYWYENLRGGAFPYFNTNVLLWLPFSLGVGLVCFIFMLFGALRLYQNNKIFLPTWALYCYLFHVFFVPELPLNDQHMVHYTSLFLVMAAYGLKEVTEAFQDRRKFSAFLYLVLVFLAIFSTNLYGSPFIYSFKRGEFVIPTPLHQRIAFEKFDKIRNVCRCAKDLKGYEWLSCLYELRID